MPGILLYIDPGTGSMLFTVMIGIVTTGVFFFRKLIMKLKFRLSGGRVLKGSGDKMPFVIFSDSKRYWNSFKPICDEFEKRKLPLAYWTASGDDPALQENYEYVSCKFIGEGNKAFARLNMMKASVCLSTTPGLDIYQWKRSKETDYYIHMLHEVGGTLLYHMFGMDYYDAVLLTGSFQVSEIRDLEHSRKDPEKELRVVGCPYMDEMKKRLDADPVPEGHKRTVLLASSWGPNSILTLYGERIIRALLQTGYEIVVRPHPQSQVSEKDLLDRLEKEFPDGEAVEWNFDTDNFDVLKRSDLMIADFSGVIFDYALVFGRPVIYSEYEFDPSVYDAAWVDRPLWRDEILPRIGRPLKEEEFGDLKRIIDETIESDYYAEGREKARSEAWMHIGQSAELTADFMVEKKQELDKALQAEAEALQTA